MNKFYEILLQNIGVAYGVFFSLLYFNKKCKRAAPERSATTGKPAMRTVCTFLWPRGCLQFFANVLDAMVVAAMALLPNGHRLQKRRDATPFVAIRRHVPSFIAADAWQRMTQKQAISQQNRMEMTHRHA